MTARPPAGPAASSAQRVDKWLWFARVLKSRTQAASLVEAGRVRINRERAARPSATVKPGDVLTVTAHSRVRVLRVLAPGVRRGPPAEAATLYEDLTPPATRPAPGTEAPASREPGTGRPTKRERRAIERFKGADEDE